jgi:hypothetical protein
MTILGTKMADGTQQFQCESHQPHALDPLVSLPQQQQQMMMIKSVIGFWFNLICN